MLGNATINSIIDHTFLAEITLFAKQGGEYRLMPYKLRKDFCSAVLEDPHFMDDIIASSTLPNRTCPLPVGVYHCNGFSPSMKNFPHAIFPSGDYRLHLTVRFESKWIFEAIFHGTIVQL